MAGPAEAGVARARAPPQGQGQLMSGAPSSALPASLDAACACGTGTSARSAHGVVRLSPGERRCGFSAWRLARWSAARSRSASRRWRCIVVSTAIVLLFGHSLGSHRKLIHDSFQCPRWLEYVLVYLGVQVGLAGPIGLLRQHELRDYAQRLPECHDYLRHGRSVLGRRVVAAGLRTADSSASPKLRDRNRASPMTDSIGLLERTWMAQHMPWAVLFYFWGGWGVRVLGRLRARDRRSIRPLAHRLLRSQPRRDAPRGRRRGRAGSQHALDFALTMGECWHNNHHAFPGSARLGLHPGEWDPGWWVLRAIRARRARLGIPAAGASRAARRS